MEMTRFHARMQSMGLVALVLGAVLLATGWSSQAYFYGWFFWVCVTLGCYAVLLMHHMTKGDWGFPIIRLLEAGGGWKMVSVFGLAFLPIAGFMMKDLYPWTHAEVAAEKVVATKMPFLEMYPWFSVATFAILIFFAYRNERWQRLEDETGERKYLQWRTNWSSGFFPFFVLLVNFVITLWVMSMMPDWFSTMYGIWFLVQQGLAAFSIIAIIVGSQAHKEPFSRVVNRKFLNDIGNMTLVCLMLWGYFSFSQYLIIWSGNLPETISYWVVRRQGGFENLGSALVLFGFFLPFIMLLSPRMKTNPKNLVFVGIVVFAIRILDIHYGIGPMLPMPGEEFAHIGTALLPKLGSFLAFGGLWCILFGAFVTKAPLLVKNQPQLKEAVDHA